MVLAQLVRAPDCGSGGRRFEPGIPPKTESFAPTFIVGAFLLTQFACLEASVREIESP